MKKIIENILPHSDLLKIIKLIKSSLSNNIEILDNILARILTIAI